MEIKHVTIAGAGGVLGSQIAFQTAYYGYPTVAYEMNEQGIANAKEKFARLGQEFINENNATEETVAKAMSLITYETDLEKAVKDCDLIIEAIPEVVEIKHDFYQKVSNLVSDKTILASNSSTLTPSMIVASVNKPERYLHMHFANKIWLKNICEIMKHEETSEEVFQAAIDFAYKIKMVPVPIYKEQPGYILNSLLVPFLRAGLQLVVDGIADPESVDRTWMISTGTNMGPFKSLDRVGPVTAYNIMSMLGQRGDQVAQRNAEYLKREMIDQGKMGYANGKGFYTYPNPAFEDPDFLKG